MNAQSISKLLEQYSNIESMLFTTDYSHFQNFLDMENFLECADPNFTSRIDDLSSKMDTLHEEYIRTSTVYEINNKKRLKEEELLLIERQKIQAQLEKHKKRLDIPVQPITLVLKEKQKEIRKLYQTKEIIQDFNKLIKGDEDELKKLMPLDDKGFNESALKIYIFKQLLESFDKPEYDLARNEIRKKFAQLKNKVLMNFKKAFLEKDLMLIKVQF